MPSKKTTNELNNTEIEAPGGTQATHSAADSGVSEVGGLGAGAGSVRGSVADGVNRISDSLERRAMELELKGGLKAKAAPAVRKAGRAMDAGSAYVRENDVEKMRGDLEEGIRTHPLKSIAIALGAGYLLAKILD